MDDTLRKSIITSESADRALRRISPIYDNSYVMLWIQEAIGREYDDLWYLVNTLFEQIFPETATWAIELWEQRYGIIPTADAPLQSRRDAVIAKRMAQRVYNPERFRRAIEKIAGVSVRIDEHYAPYTFAVYLQSPSRLPEAAIHSAICRMKQSHMTYVLLYESYMTTEQFMASAITWHGEFTVKQAF